MRERRERSPHQLRFPHDLRPPWSQSARFVPRRFVQPALEYLRTEAAGGVIMLLAAIAAIVWANSPEHESYTRLIETRLAIDLGGVLRLDHDLREWVNDALMVVFFFVVGLEIKRELVVGELRDPRAAALPALAALGGMLCPALIYLAFNAGTSTSGGWGIPMATDIAFAVGVASLVGNRVSIGAKLFLLALAIVDDLGAIAVIAVFYTEELAVWWLATALGGLVLVAIMRRLEIRSTAMYVIVGVGVWLAMLESGVHATIAGVALALLTPTDPFYRADDFAASATGLVRRVTDYAGDPAKRGDQHSTERMQALLRDLHRLSIETVSPLDRLEHRLALWSSFVVVPIFAFVNAGVRISADALASALGNRVLLGVFLGLLTGKVIGVSGAAWLAVRLGLGRLPRHTGWRQMVGLGFLAGIGFTVALFVTALSFEDPTATDAAKMGIFAASILAGVLGFLWLRASPSAPTEEGLSEETQLTTA